ncbi:hypothetical protein A1O7_05166 [Cladophialophora yegresii CBS 114405]|uniref:Uncharacterized protein n=1 Tax=Cladophialophora yegresii CBS 114405 TaxID=1182544 RepID=W9VZC0_9EURO|nr:uncharacterized protein A1O7_05166 [Cladophialophora yegresii CBS 114405]EXJ61013.1 hypothetical protein A1O7_05166 [Cladophialophora yegresii CBS 114405]
MPSGQSLLWVNHDADNMRALPHRHRVFTHVQKNYRPWKRRQETNSLRASAKVPAQASIYNRNDYRGRDRSPSEGANSTRSVPSSPALGSPPSGSVFDDTDPSAFSNGGPEIWAASPSTSIGKGNSDPFGAYPIPITADVNNLMTFYRDYIIPSIWFKNFRNKNTIALAAREWQYNAAHLEDEGTAYGIIARHGMVAASCSPALRKQAEYYVGQSTEVLRKKVAQGRALQAHSSSSFIDNAAMLFNAETLARNLVAATAHGTFLTSLFKQQWTQGKLDYRLLMYEVYNDCQLTSIFLCPPVFDVDHWLTTVFDPIWRTAIQRLPHLACAPLDPSVDSQELQTWFRSRQEQLQIYGVKDGEGKLFLDVPVIMTWFLSKAYIFHGHMINHYLRNRAQLRRQGLKPEVKDYLYAQQYMALAAIYLTRGPNFNFNPTVLNVPMFDASIIPRTLRTLLEESEISSKRPSWKRYVNARLWAYYVGALVEQAEATTRLDPRPQWFTTHLIELAAKLGVMSWHMLEGLLRGFLYSDILTAQGSQWFEQLMAAFCNVES